MNRILLSIFSLSLSAATLSAASGTPRVNINSITTPSVALSEAPSSTLASHTLQSVPAVQLSPASRAADHTVYTDVKATGSIVWYMGDLLGNGTAYYYIFLSDCGVSEGGGPEGPGHLARILCNAPAPADPKNLTIPEGTWTASETYAVGNFALFGDSQFIDCFVDPDTGEGLVGYIYDLTAGSLTVKKTDDGSCAISFEGKGAIYDDVDETKVIATADISMSYAGAIPAVSDETSSYPTFEAGRAMDIPDASGRYSGGGYSICFYGCPLDRDGFIIGAGDFLNIELNVESEGTPLLARNYTWYDLQALMDGTATAPYGPGTFMGGMMYNMYGMTMPIGTYFQHFNSDGYADAIALAAEGSKINVTDKGNGIYLFEFDILSPEGHRFTGSWEGDIAPYVLDFPQQSAIADILAPAEAGPAEYFNLQGLRIASPAKGSVVIRRAADGTASKILF